MEFVLFELHQKALFDQSGNVFFYTFVNVVEVIVAYESALLQLYLRGWIHSRPELYFLLELFHVTGRTLTQEAHFLFKPALLNNLLSDSFLLLSNNYLTFL